MIAAEAYFSLCVCVCVCVLILQEKLRIAVLVSKAAFQSIQGEVVSNLVN